MYEIVKPIDLFGFVNLVSDPVLNSNKPVCPNLDLATFPCQININLIKKKTPLFIDKLLTD